MRAGPREKRLKFSCHGGKKAREKYDANTFSGLILYVGGVMKKKNIAWICLILSGLMEFVWAYFLKESYGFTKLVPSMIAIIFIAISFFLLERGIRQFGIGMSYAIFTGIGIAGTAVIGIVAFHESASIPKLISLCILLTGIIGLKFSENESENEEVES